MGEKGVLRMSGGEDDARDKSGQKQQLSSALPAPSPQVPTGLFGKGLVALAKPLDFNCLFAS